MWYTIYNYGKLCRRGEAKNKAPNPKFEVKKLDKAEYKIKLEQISACAESGDFRGAARTADTIDWRRVKSARTLCMISEIYEANKRYEDGMEILKYAYRRSPQSKTVLYRLTETSLRTGNLSDAKKYYAEFEQAAQHDTSRYVLKYKLLRAEDAPLEEQIAVLKEYKEREYTERWAYELAKLYKKNGQKQRCIEECDDMILWFAEGRYVTRAMELKMQLTPLSESQKAKYESRLAAAKEAAEREALLREETKTVLDAAEDNEDIVSGGEEPGSEPGTETDEESGGVTTAEMIEKMNAAADASLQGARAQSRMPNVRPAARQSISGRNAGSNDMQDQLASSIRAVFSGIRSQSDEETLESDRQDMPAQDVHTEDTAVPADEEDLDLAALFAETENSMAQTVQAATSDDETGGADEAPKAESAAQTPAEPSDTEKDRTGEQETDKSDGNAADAAPEADDAFEDEAADDTNVFYIEKNGVIEIVSAEDASKEGADVKAVSEARKTDSGSEGLAVPDEKPDGEKLIGMETDESLGLTREFNFGRELENLAGSRAKDSKPARTQRTENKVETRIPDPEEAAVKIVSEAARTQGVPASDNALAYENVAELSERLFSGMAEISAGGFINVDGKTDEVPAKTSGQPADSVVPKKEAAGAAESARAVPETNKALSENKNSIIDHLLDEPDMIDRMDIVPRTLDETERKLFTYFSSIPGIGEQVSLAIADIHNNSGDRTSKSGNVLIVGRRGSGKTKLADSLVLAVCKDLNITAAKTAKIIASDFNQKDAAAIVKKMAGGFLIIEGAGELAADTVDKLNRAMEFRTDDMVVILEDEKQDMKALLDRYPEFAAKFTSRITIPVFTNDELVTFGKTYAQENGYSFDEMATLALYTMIGENQKDSEPVTVGMVRDMIDKAIARSKSKKFPLFGKNQVGADGRIILREKDFAF